MDDELDLPLRARSIGAALRGGAGDPRRSNSGRVEHHAPDAERASIQPAASQIDTGAYIVSGFVRPTHFVVVGIGGWLIGGTIGGFVGVGLDLLFVGDTPPEFGVSVAPLFWKLGWLGAIAGLVGSVMWVASRMGRNQT